MWWWRGSVMFSFPGTHKHKLGWNSNRSRVNKTYYLSIIEKNPLSIYFTLYKSQVQKFTKTWFFAYEGYVTQSLGEGLEFSGIFQLGIRPRPLPSRSSKLTMITPFLQRTISFLFERIRIWSQILVRCYSNCVKFWKYMDRTERLRHILNRLNFSSLYSFLQIERKSFSGFFLLVWIDPDKCDNMTWRIRDEFINIVHICLIRIFCLFTSKHSHGVVKTFPSLPRINFNSAELYIWRFWCVWPSIDMHNTSVYVVNFDLEYPSQYSFFFILLTLPLRLVSFLLRISNRASHTVQ